jgi:IS30 family transposase
MGKTVGRRRPQGRRRLLLERKQYFELMEKGYSNTSACEIVGINVRTGREWKNGAVRLKRDGKPIRVHDGFDRGEELDALNHYLRQQDRIQIADLRRSGLGIRAIAREMGRSPSTISREISRNSHETNRQYHPYAAHERARRRKPRPKVGKIATNPALHTYIQQHLALRFSPEQIHYELKARFPEDRTMQVSIETIYQSLYIQGRGELKREIARALRTGRTIRKPHRQSNKRKVRFSQPMVMISQRPAEVKDRAVPGHWEGDLIIGKDHHCAMGTLVERTTRFMMLVHLPDAYDAASVRDGLMRTIGNLPIELRKSLTWDQGSEMGEHKKFSVDTKTQIYFCDPASPWQRGSNENTNGLLRQYFPKGTHMHQYSGEDLVRVAHELNIRPRKTLGWKTPAECFNMLLNEGKAPSVALTP